MNRSFIYIAAIFILLDICLLGFYFAKNRQWSLGTSQTQRGGNEEEPPLYKEGINQTLASLSSYPSATPIPRPIPRGKTGFTISSGDEGGPQTGSGFIDPYDPEVGEKQTISITVKDNQPVTSVSVTMKTDNGLKEYPMKLAEGTATDGRWEGTWAVEDTHLYMYHAILKAVGAKGESLADITLR